MDHYTKEIMSKPKIFDQDWYAGPPFASIDNHRTEDGTYRKGYFVDDVNTVLIYSSRNYVHLSIYIKGRGYYRTVRRDRPYTDIGLARLAGKFSREIQKKINDAQNQN